jgi:GMP synthase (glutamine-hydrolysing)
MLNNQVDVVPIAILDFGSQFSHLISRRLRDANIYCEIFQPDIALSDLESKQVKGIILSGGPSSVYEADLPDFNEAILDMDIPILGICYGYQLMSKLLGGTVAPLERKEFGRAELNIQKQSALFGDIPSSQNVWMSHGDSIVKLPRGFSQIGTTSNCIYAAAEDADKKRYGLQFHPEVAHTEYGQRILANFALEICHCEANWSVGVFLDNIEGYIKDTVGSRNVFLLVSGGIDSTVVFVLLNRILGPSRVLGIFINTGLLRPGDSEMVERLFNAQGIKNYEIVDASNEFLSALNGVQDPEKKRNIIGQLFLDVKDRIMSGLDLDASKWVLAQGTIYPDIITSGGSKHARVIKTHHNALPTLKKNMEVLEPLRYLYKDEVRKLAAELGFSHDFVWKHPFPGPGIAVRIAGAITEAKVELYHKLDTIVLHHLRSSGWYEQLWMGFPILIDMTESSEVGFTLPEDSRDSMIDILHQYLRQSGIAYDCAEVSVLPIRSVGVKGDYRTYEHPVELRVRDSEKRCHIPHEVMEKISKEFTNSTPLINRVLLAITWSGHPGLWRKIVVLRMLQSVDTLTSDWGKLEHELLDRIGEEIMSTASDIDAILLDVTQKPPSTMEWE